MATQRNGRQAVRNSGSGIPGWGLFIAGVVVGLVVMGFIAHRGLIPSLRRADQPQANPNAVAQKGSAPGIASSSAAASGSQFDFYKVLPEKEVVIPNAELSAMAKAEQQKAAAASNASTATAASGAPAGAATNATNAAVVANANTAHANAAPAAAAASAPAAGGYILQVGAYPDVAKAEAMKAQLALQGFTANVQSVTLDGQVWNRVRIGPFATATRLQSVQKQLAGAGIHAIPLKEK